MTAALALDIPGAPGLFAGLFAAVVILRIIQRLKAYAIGSSRAAKAAPPPEATPLRFSRHIPQDVKIAVTLRDGGKCRVCGSKERLQYDHIYPWSLGGRSDDPNNIQLLCGYHNRLKSNR